MFSIDRWSYAFPKGLMRPVQPYYRRFSHKSVINVITL
jgi:hypothetical protein